MVKAAVIQQVGKVDLLEVQTNSNGTPLYRLRFMRPTKPLWAQMYDRDVSPTTTLDIATIQLTCHRMRGTSVNYAYWPDNWSDQWGVDEILEWEWPGWKEDNKNRHDPYYADFIIRENQPTRSDEQNPHGPQPALVSGVQGSVDDILHGKVHGRGLDDGHPVLRLSESKSVLSLERELPSGHASDISREDGDH